MNSTEQICMCACWLFAGIFFMGGLMSIYAYRKEQKKREQNLIDKMQEEIKELQRAVYNIKIERKGENK